MLPAHSWHRHFRPRSRLHGVGLRDKQLRWILPINVLFGHHRAVQPALVLARVQDHHHALFIVGLVEALHQRVPVGVDRQHRERQQLVRWSVFPNAGDGHRAAVRALDVPAHRLAGFVVGFEEIGGRDDAELLAPPGAAEGWLAGHSLGAGIIGLASEL